MPTPFSSVAYNTLIRRNSVFLAVIFGSAFAFEMTFDKGFDLIWDRLNKGRQWKDMRHKYLDEE